jgi:hypothetical protein
MVTMPTGLSTSQLHKDWIFLYVNMYGLQSFSQRPSDIQTSFVDRDMFVRYLGDGIRHASARCQNGREDFEGAIPEQQTASGDPEAEGLTSNDDKVDENDLED